MKVVFVSTLLPSGHYSQILTRKLSHEKDIELIIYSNDNRDNLKITDCGEIKTVWSKGIKFGLQIYRELKKDRPDVVHLQHEFNMYGGLPSAVLFPFFILWLRLHRFYVVVTVHSVVPIKQINKDFIDLFSIKPLLARPVLLKLVFATIYRVISSSANKIIVHTRMMRKTLISDYGANEKKVQVLKTAIPESRKLPRTAGNYFFYFGYMVRRKGLGYLLDGFSKYIKSHPESKFKLIMAGGAIKGQEKSRDEILQTIKDKGLGDKIQYVGFIDQNQQDELYSDAYAVVLPAKISVAASGPLYYSFGYRRCPIASDVGNLCEEIEDGKTGILISNLKWDKAFEYAVNNPKILLQIEKNIETVAFERSPLAMAAKYVKIYNDNN